MIGSGSIRPRFIHWDRWRIVVRTIANWIKAITKFKAGMEHRYALVLTLPEDIKAIEAGPGYGELANLTR